MQDGEQEPLRHTEQQDECRKAADRMHEIGSRQLHCPREHLAKAEPLEHRRRHHESEDRKPARGAEAEPGQENGSGDEDERARANGHEPRPAISRTALCDRARARVRQRQKRACDTPDHDRDACRLTDDDLVDDSHR